jgi:hypothetical protein
MPKDARGFGQLSTNRIECIARHDCITGSGVLESSARLLKNPVTGEFGGLWLQIPVWFPVEPLS